MSVSSYFTCMFLGTQTGKFDLCSSYIYCYSYKFISNWLPVCKHVVHKIWGFHSSLAEDSSLLGCDAVSLDEWFPKFQMSIKNHSLNQWHHHIPDDLNLYVVCNLVAFSKNHTFFCVYCQMYYLQDMTLYSVVFSQVMFLQISWGLSHIRIGNLW
jgi:hypothetical protein